MASRGISPWLNVQWLNHVFRGITYTPPTALYLRLYKDDPRLYPESEVDPVVDDTAYAPQLITFGVAEYWDNTTFSGKWYWRVVNDAAVTFATTVYGTGGAPVPIAYVGITDQSGNLLAMQTLLLGDYWETALTAGDALQFAIGTVMVCVEDGVTNMEWQSLTEDLLNHVFNGVTYTAPTSITLGMFYDESGGTYLEVDTVAVDTAYARQAVTGFTEPFSPWDAYGDPDDQYYCVLPNHDIEFPAVVYGTNGTSYNCVGLCFFDQAGNRLLSVTDESVAGGFSTVLPIVRTSGATLTVSANTLGAGFWFEAF